MIPDPSLVRLSPSDEERFGFRTARAPLVTAETLPRVLEFCREENAALLIARCRTTEIRAAQAMEGEGFSLADTLVYYVRNLLRTEVPPVPPDIIVRPVRPGEENAVRDIAAGAFQVYEGHYQSDDRLSRVSSAEIYSSWAHNACLSRDQAHEVLVAERKNTIVGFTLMQMNSLDEGEGRLQGVAPSVPKRSSIQRAMALGGLLWSRERGAARVLASVVITNTVMQKIITRIGFEPFESYYTFHKWFI